MEIDNIVLRNTDKKNGFYVFRSKENELLCRRIEDGEMSENAEVLADITDADFDAVIDKGDTLHVVTGSRNGDVIYLRKIDNVWKKAAFLKLRKEFCTKAESFFMFKTEEGILVIYVISYDGRKTLCRQSVSDKIDTPIVLAELDDNSPIFVCQNNSGDIFALYTDYERGEFGYRCSLNEGKEWSSFSVIEGDGKGIQNVSAECDREQLYVCYRHKGGIHFRCVGKGAEILDSQILTRKHVENCSKLIMNCRDDLLRLFWNNKSSMICAVRDNSARAWSRLAERNFKNSGLLMAFKLVDAEKEMCVYDCGIIEGNTVVIHELGEYFRRDTCKVGERKNANELGTLIKKLKIILKELEEMKKKADFSAESGADKNNFS